MLSESAWAQFSLQNTHSLPLVNLAYCSDIVAEAHRQRYITGTSSSRASRGRKFQKKKEVDSKERICL